ncbi:MAG: Caspase domain-containing protein [Cyanobacteria bacterium]|nr:Caspase domain-containing protein [Cyanobacteriota bacterium]MDA0865434.1 Caspase domain-containing protein [Cyanobacteriota bacterium]
MAKFRQSLIALLVIGGAIATAALGNPPQSGAALWRWFANVPNPSQARADGLTTHFLVVAGGGAPSYNEIALEKNVRYFQRTLAWMGLDQAPTDIFFANGDSGEATVRYVDRLGREQFKVPDIPALTGAATFENVHRWIQTAPERPEGAADCPTFFYFTGHGYLNPEDAGNNDLILWEESLVSVQQLARWLDQWPAEMPFVTMMAQCFSGSFANLIYEGGDPEQPVALQTRCGFFATVETRPSVGCTPLVDEADYEDYSSSFFAGLSGRDRVGNRVPSADYDQDGQITFAEAHAFAKVDEVTPDWPISTSEAWLQRQASEAEVLDILAQPIETWYDLARPEQRHVIDGLSDRLGYDRDRSLIDNTPFSSRAGVHQVQRAYHMRLRMELINVAVERRLRSDNDFDALSILGKLLACEAGTW